MATNNSVGSQRLPSLMVADKAPPSLSVDRPQVTGLRSPARSIRHTDSDAGSIRSLSSETTYEFEAVYENQRGMFVFGVPKFSAKMLNVIDPPPWSDSEFRFVSPNLHSYQLPDPNWEWAHPEWTIDMSYDVDEEGWEYAFHFHNSYWHGTYNVVRSFVRRRRWVRLRRRKLHNETNIHGHPIRSRRPSAQPNARVSSVGSTDQEFNRQQNWLVSMRRMRIDREKLDYLNQLLESSAGTERWLTNEMLLQFLYTLDYHANRYRAIELMKKHGYEPPWTSGIDAFTFYTDRIALQQLSSK
ncbi:hypothetical protein BDF19DRAFT_440285 [Syncephalis fuscata]|nr:hypothetical protein BDF19DRAFT_440285 [Syncephalis fuscata]